MRRKYLMRVVPVLAVAVTLSAFPPAAGAATVVYTDEGAYLAAVAGGGYDTFSEGFESSDWDLSRPDGTPSITAQGLTWTASDLVRTAPGWARTGSYGVFDSFGDPDHLFGAGTSAVLYGLGGWFAKTDAPSVSISLDGGAPVATVVPLGRTFLGVVDTDGFTSFTLSTTSGHWGADDFTFARGNPAPEVPEPGTIFLVAGALLGVSRIARRRARTA